MNMTFFSYLLFPILFCCLNLAVVHARILDAKTCSQADVQASIDTSVDGDVVKIPAGSCTWELPVSVNKKAIDIIGAGIDLTKITDGTGSAWGQTPIWIVGVDGKKFRISGFTFLGGTISDPNGIVFVQGTSKEFRIDHCKFSLSMNRAIRIQGYTYGVIDHCQFIVPSGGTVQGISIVGDGDAAWERPLTLGSEKAVYVEDCFFDYGSANDGVLDAYNGARYVFRHNVVKNTLIGHHGFDSGGYRSTHSFEIYENTFTSDSDSAISRCAINRGGTGVYFDNTWTGNYQNGIGVSYYRSCCSRSTDCSNWGRCDGSNPIDGNEDDSGYPCKDQIGRTTGQVLSPTYAWNNKLNGEQVGITVYDVFQCANPAMSDHIKENRDFFNGIPKPSYSPYIYPHPLGESLSTPSNLRILR